MLFNYLENNQKIPWDDLKYMFCDILYGGHITDDWDRRYCRTFLETLMTEDLFEDKMLAPEFPAPPPSSLDEYRQYVIEYLPPENPKLFGLHPNAEIGFLTVQSNVLLKTIFELQPRNNVSGQGISREDRIKDALDEILDQLPENFDMTEIMERVEERTPYISVCLQECDRMNILLTTMRTSLIDVNLGLKGELTISETMEAIMDALFLAKVPDMWQKAAYPSLKPLPLWFADLQRRVKQLTDWQGDLNLPPVVWLSGLFNPQSFLRGVLQATARANQWPLDKMFLNVEVSKKNVEDITVAPRDGAYISGLYMEGARWDKKSGCIRDSLMKELFSELPPIFLRAVPLDKMDTRDTYVCPVYKISKRGPTYVWSFNLKTRDPPSKWILAGVALLLSTD